MMGFTGRIEMGLMGIRVGEKRYSGEVRCRGREMVLVEVRTGVEKNSGVGQGDITQKNNDGRKKK